MISFNYLGNLGRLGNQMFQYAALIGISEKHGYDYCLPPKNIIGTIDYKCKNSDTTLFDCFIIPTKERQFSTFPTITEESFNFDKRLFQNCRDNVNLHGYFQSEKYFKHIENQIRKHFTFLDNIKIPTTKLFNKTFGDAEVISLHIRRGDYVGNSNHPTQSLEYYENAISLFDNNLPIMIFSDDIKWCKNQNLFSGDRFVFSENNSTGIDLMLQTLCKYHIIANSSFSWWGAWLAKSKRVIAPKMWFFNEDLNKNTNDLYCKSWVKI